MIGNYLTPKLPTWTIPITRGADRTFTLVCRVSEGGAETDWNAAVFMDIDTKPVATRVDAVVAGSRATFTIESEIAGLCTNSTAWRIIRDSGSSELPVMVGVFERNDGR